MRIDTGYFEGEFIQDLDKIMNDLLKMRDSFTTGIPSDFEYKDTLYRLEDTRSSAMNTKRKLFVCAENIVDDWNKAERDAMQIMDDLSFKAYHITPFKEKTLKDADELADDTKQIREEAAQSIKDVTAAEIAIYDKNYKEVDQGNIFDMWSYGAKDIKKATGAKIDGIKQTAAKAWKETKQSFVQFGMDSLSVFSSLKNGDFKGAWRNFKTTVKHTGATFVNNSLAGVEGVLDFGEGILDFSKMVWAGQATPITFLYDKVTGSNVTDKMWGYTMNSVADDSVGDAFDTFYKTDVGMALDKNAYTMGKSDSAAHEMTVALSEAAPTVVLTIVTGGTYAVPIGLMSGASAAGKYAEADWQKDRANSIEGIEYLYKEGKIDQQYYDAVMTINGYTDEEWQAITAARNEGKISQEDYDALNQVRNMPEEWTTAENAIRTVSAATLVGAIDAAAVISGSKLSQWQGIGAQAVVNESGQYVRSIGSTSVFNRLLSSGIKVFDYAALAELSSITKAVPDLIADENKDAVSVLAQRSADGNVAALMATGLGSISELKFIFGSGTELRPGEYIQENAMPNTSKTGVVEVLKPDEVILPEGYDSTNSFVDDIIDVQFSPEDGVWKVLSGDNGIKYLDAGAAEVADFAGVQYPLATLSDTGYPLAVLEGNGASSLLPSTPGAGNTAAYQNVGNYSFMIDIPGLLAQAEHAKFVVGALSNAATVGTGSGGTLDLLGINVGEFGGSSEMQLRANIGNGNVTTQTFKDLYYYSYTDSSGKVIKIKPFSQEYYDAVGNNLKLQKVASDEYFALKQALQANNPAENASKTIEMYTKISTLPNIEDVAISYYVEYPNGTKLEVTPYSSEYNYMVQSGAKIQVSANDKYYQIVQRLMNDCNITYEKAANYLQNYYYRDQIATPKSSINTSISKVEKVQIPNANMSEAEKVLAPYMEQCNSEYTKRMMIKGLENGTINSNGDLTKYIQRYNEISAIIEDRLEFAELIKKSPFWDPKDDYKLSPERIRSKYEKINIVDEAKLMQIYTNLGGNPNGAKPGGFWIRKSDDVFLIIDDKNFDSTLEHEINHSLGHLYDTNDIMGLTGMNEAQTEKLAHYDGTEYQGYVQLPQYVQELDEVLHSKGYGDVAVVSYFGTNKGLYRSVVDYVAGKNGYYDRLTQLFEQYRSEFENNGYVTPKMYETGAEIEAMINALR